MNRKVLLDGEYVDSSIINPRDHKFIGYFRPVKPTDSIYCPCGSYLGNMLGPMNEHLRAGHMDIPQYKTIDKTNE